VLLFRLVPWLLIYVTRSITKKLIAVTVFLTTRGTVNSLEHSIMYVTERQVVHEFTPSWNKACHVHGV